jgi:hypothetical protein
MLAQSVPRWDLSIAFLTRVNRNRARGNANWCADDRLSEQRRPTGPKYLSGRFSRSTMPHVFLGYKMNIGISDRIRGRARNRADRQGSKQA